MVAVIAGIASKQGRLTSREGVFPRHCGVLARVEAMPHRSTPLLLLLPALPAIALLLAIAAMPAIRGRPTSREGVFPRRCGVLVRVGCLPHRSAPLLLPLLAMTAIALLLAIEAQRASQLRMRTSACSSQTMTGLRTFNPKVVGSSPTGGTSHSLGPTRDRGLTCARNVRCRNPTLGAAGGIEVSNPHPEELGDDDEVGSSPTTFTS